MFAGARAQGMLPLIVGPLCPAPLISLALSTSPALVSGPTTSNPTVMMRTVQSTPVPSPGPTTTGTMYFVRPAITDAESGIRLWYGRVADVAPTVVEGEGWIQLSDTTGTMLGISGVPYATPRYFAIAARNGAGTFSAPVVTSAPVRLADPTVAPVPNFCLENNTGSIAVRMGQLSRDPESGVVGYQLRLRTQAGTVLRDWPTGTAVDLPAQIALDVVTPVPGVAMPTSGLIVAEIRAVNGGGALGDQAASGAILVDGTPPPTPTITVATIPTSSRFSPLGFRLTVVTAADPESGFGGLDVRVDDVSPDRTGPRLEMVPWTAVPNAVVGAGTYTISVPSQATRSLVVTVRTRNGIGMTSFVTNYVIYTSPPSVGR